MRRTIHCLLALMICVSLFSGCQAASALPSSTDTQPIVDATAPTAEETIPIEATQPETTPATEVPSAPRETEAATAPPATERPTTPPATEEPETIQPTDDVWTERFCSACGVWYDGIDLVDGVCADCRNGTCFLCGGPLGPDHDCDDYPNVVCPNPDCDWGIYTTGVGIDGIICPQCGTRCV